jgi:hypothetical protein
MDRAYLKRYTRYCNSRFFPTYLVFDWAVVKPRLMIGGAAKILLASTSQLLLNVINGRKQTYQNVRISKSRYLKPTNQNVRTEKD